MSGAVLIQLARLGDLAQSLPVITALHSRYPDQSLDLLCPSPLAPLGELFPGIAKVYPWDGAIWQPNSMDTDRSWAQQLRHMKQVWTQQSFPTYSVAYNLNNHPRSILAAHLLADTVVGPGSCGPVNPWLSPWGDYLRTVARHRGSNRVHLSDAFCGLCQVRPPTNSVSLVPAEMARSSELAWLGDFSGRPIIGMIVGAGDPERRIPVAIWKELIQACAASLPDACFLLIGGEGEREIGLTIENILPASCLNRVMNVCGATSLVQLVALLSRCQWVMGSDTGPLHLGTLCGARAVGWYFARARVHETGPYGEGHYVWQYSQDGEGESAQRLAPLAVPAVWPVWETVRVVLGQHVTAMSGLWSLWESQQDELGTYYQGPENADVARHARQEIWERLSPDLAYLKA